MKVQCINNPQNYTTFNAVKNYKVLGDAIGHSNRVEEALKNSKVLQNYIKNNDVNIELVAGKCPNSPKSSSSYAKLLILSIHQIPIINKPLIETITISAFALTNKKVVLYFLAEQIKALKTHNDLRLYMTHSTPKSN